jgi:uncharacterized membrane protein
MEGRGAGEMTVSELSQALAVRGLMAEDQQLTIAPAPPENDSPWYVQVMLGACAWFAGILLLAFVILALFEAFFRNHENWWAIVIISACTCAGAAFLYAVVDAQSTFGDQFALAMSIAGQVGIAIGLGGVGHFRLAVWSMVMVEVALTVAVRNRLHRILTSAAAVFAWAMATHEILFRELPGVSIWGAAQQNVYQTSLVSVVLWLVVWAPVAYAAYWLVSNEARWMAEGHETLLRPVTYGALASLSIAPLITHPATFWMALGLGSAREFRDGSPGVTALWPLLAMLLSILALALAFAIRNRPLMGLAIVFGMLEVSSFYYVLGTTLLTKSIIMIVLGVVLIASTRLIVTESK